MSATSLFSLPVCTLAALLSCAVFSGCESRTPDELARAVAMGERPVAMKGVTTFFDGQLAAEVTISRGIGKGYAGADERKTNIFGTPNRIDLPGSVGSERHMIGRTGPEEGREDPNLRQDVGPTNSANINPSHMATEPDVREMDEDEARAYLNAKAAVGSPLPPVTLHLRLQNLGADKEISIQIQDFESELGSFAVQPDTLKIAAQAVTEPEPMVSQLGVTSDVIPVKLTLKLGRKKETQTILVKSLLLAPSAPAPAK